MTSPADLGLALWLVSIPATAVGAVGWIAYDRARRKLYERRMRRYYLRIAAARRQAMTDGTLILFPGITAGQSGRSARGTAPRSHREAR